MSKSDWEHWGRGDLWGMLEEWWDCNQERYGIKVSEAYAERTGEVDPLHLRAIDDLTRPTRPRFTPTVGTWLRERANKGRGSRDVKAK
jgi:hypothetical protein